MAETEAEPGARKLTALALFVSLLLVCLGLRVATIFFSDLGLGDILVLRALVSDIGAAAIVALLISFVPLRSLQIALGILICVFAAANLEHILANGANMDVAFSRYLADATFLTGSVLNLKLGTMATLSALLFSFTAIGFDKVAMANLSAAARLRGPAFSVGLLSALCTMLLFFIPVSLVNAYWTQANFIEENAKNIITGQDSVKMAGSQNTELETYLYHQDLDGESLLSDARKKNVVLVLIEGISQAHLVQGWMPWFSEASEQNYQLSSFIANQRQTNRGLYSILCGRYPNLSSKAAKSDIVGSFGTRDPCLPSHLRDFGYRTVFMQSAELGFMRKDLFASAAGFDEYLGDSDYGEAHNRTDWGVDDLTLYENARTKMSELQAQDKPWFLTLLTSGTHQPFNNPDGINTQEGAIAYADKSLKKLLEWAAADGLLEDTLFIISSDEASTSIDVDQKNVISNNWAPLLVLDDSIRAPVSEGVFSQVDIPLSIMDYLSLPISDDLYGRSIFRAYSSARTIYFANVYTGLIFSLTGDREIIACNRTLQCGEYSTSATLFQYPLKDMAEAPAAPQAVSVMRNVIAQNDREYSEFGEKPIFTLKDREFSDQENYTLLSQFQVELQQGETLSFEVDIANDVAESPGKLLADLIYYTCQEATARGNQQFYIQENEVVKIRDLKVVAEADANICSFLIIHSQTGAKFKLDSLSVRLSG